MKQEGGQQEGEEEGITEGEVRYQIKKLKREKRQGTMVYTMRYGCSEAEK